MIVGLSESTTVSIGSAAIPSVAISVGTVYIYFYPPGAGDYLATWTAEEAETVEVYTDYIPVICGTYLILQITNDATLPRTITFGTGFKAVGTLVGTISKMATILFRSNGTNFIELCRTLVITP